MTDEQLYCDVADCDDPENHGYARPVAGHGQGKCSTHLKQLQRTGKTTTIAEKLTPIERCIKAGTAMLEAGDNDEEYEQAKRAFILQARNLGGRAAAVEAIKAGLAEARARGVRIGRPPKISTERVLELVKLLGKPALVAQVLGVHRVTVYKVLARCSQREGSATPDGNSPRLAG